MTRFVGTGDENRFENERHNRLEQMDLDYAGELPIEILPTHTDENGVTWQLPHEDSMGWARLVFDLLQAGKIMVSYTKHPLSYKLNRYGEHEVAEWQAVTFCIWIEDGEYYVMELTGDDTKEYTRPASDTYGVFMGAVGLGYDFSGVRLW